MVPAAFNNSVPIAAVCDELFHQCGNASLKEQKQSSMWKPCFCSRGKAKGKKGLESYMAYRDAREGDDDTVIQSGLRYGSTFERSMRLPRLCELGSKLRQRYLSATLSRLCCTEPQCFQLFGFGVNMAKSRNLAVTRHSGFRGEGCGQKCDDVRLCVHVFPRGELYGPTAQP